MASASGGRMSSMYSGNTQLRTDNHQGNDADANRYEPDKAKLPVGQLRQTGECFAPDARRDQGQQALEHQHQGTRRQENFRHRLPRSDRYLPERRCAARPPPDCFRYWKKSALGSSTMTSLLFLNVALYASRLR